MKTLTTLAIALAILMIPTTGLCLDENLELIATPIIFIKTGGVSVTGIGGINNIEATEAVTSTAIAVMEDAGYYSAQISITGAGTAQLEYHASNDGFTFKRPEGVTAFLTGMTATSGPDSDGRLITSFDVIPCKFFKLEWTETGKSSGMRFEIILGRQ